MTETSEQFDDDLGDEDSEQTASTQQTASAQPPQGGSADADPDEPTD